MDAATKKRQAKAKGKGYIKGKILRPPQSIYDKYTDGVMKLTRQMTEETTRELIALFRKDFAQEHFATMDDKSTASQTRILINKLKAKYDGLFGKLALGLSPWMADSINRSSASQVKGSVEDMPNLKEQSGKLTLDVRKLDERGKQILKSTTARSSDFIKSIPERHLNSVADATYNSITNGNGLQDLEGFLEQFDQKTQNWAHNTALDQTRKAFNGLNAGRMKQIGIERGEWIHSGGSQHPRELHEEFDGQTFDLNKGAPVGDDDGNDVMPGDEPNCRCTFAPVIPLGDGSDDDENEDDDSDD
jgi:uncharacterized protein with gpF-like domain